MVLAGISRYCTFRLLTYFEDHEWNFTVPCETHNDPQENWVSTGITQSHLLVPTAQATEFWILLFLSFLPKVSQDTPTVKYLWFALLYTIHVFCNIAFHRLLYMRLPWPWHCYLGVGYIAAEKHRHSLLSTHSANTSSSSRSLPKPPMKASIVAIIALCSTVCTHHCVYMALRVITHH